MSGLVIGIGLSIALFGLPASKWCGRYVGLMDGTAERKRLRTDLTKWLVTGLLLCYLFLVESESLSSIGAVSPEALPLAGGLPEAVGLIIWWIAGTIGTIVLTTVLYVGYQHFDFSVPEEVVEDQGDRSVPSLLVIAVTAGVTESVLYGAYPIERLATLTGSLVVAGALTWLVFTAVHYVGETFTGEETIYIGGPALAVTILYVLSGSLVVIVLVHSSVNILSFMT